MAPRQRPFEPLKAPLFRRLWIASVFFGTANLVQVVASNWLMLEMTGSPFWVGLMVATPTVPMLVVVLPSGALADIIERRRVLIVAATLMVAASSSILLLHVLGLMTPGRLLSLGVLLGSGTALYFPAWQATISDLVPRRQVSRAVSLNSASGSIALAVGPLLGGFTMAEFGFWVPSTIAVGGFSVLLVNLIAAPRLPVKTRPHSSLRTAVVSGLRYVRHSPNYRALLGIAAAFGAGAAALRAVLPSLVDERLLAESGAYGMMLGSMGIGAFLGSILRERVQWAVTSRLVPLAVGGYGAVGIAVATSTSLLLSMGAMTVAGFCWMLALSTLQSQFQLLAPEWVRARALSVYNLALLGMMTMGTITAGIVGDRLGPSAAVLLGSGLLLLLTLRSWGTTPVDAAEQPNSEPIGVRPEDHHPDILSSERVLVATVWTIEPGRAVRFTEAMGELRHLRLRTGADRWMLYRDVVQPMTFVEVFEVETWEQHLEQHRRLDVEAIGLIHRVADFDVMGGPRSIHLVGVDRDGLTNPNWSSVSLASHRETHEADGSIRLYLDGPVPAGQGPHPHSEVASSSRGVPHDARGWDGDPSEVGG